MRESDVKRLLPPWFKGRLRVELQRWRTSEADLLGLLALLTPYSSGLPLIRLGSEGDGGYLVPDDLQGIGALFSPGVDATWTFEADIANRFGIPSFMCDGSVNAPLDLTSLQHFERLWLSPKTGPGKITLQDWIERHRAEEDCDLMLQMDIEGAEYDVLKFTPREVLRRFRVMVVEFHGLDLLTSQWIFRSRARVFRKLAQDFLPVHIHANNCCGCFMLGQYRVPRVLEMTYLRRDRVFGPLEQSAIPHAADRPCVPSNPAIKLRTGWPFEMSPAGEEGLFSL